MSRCIYIVRYSCLHTLAQKYNTTIRKIFIKFPDPTSSTNVSVKYVLFTVDEKNGKVKPLTKAWTLFTYYQVIALTNRDVDREISENLRKISKGIFYYPNREEQQRTPRIMDMDFLKRIQWVNFRTQASFDMPCCICGSLSGSHMHHVKHSRKNKYSLIPKEMTLKLKRMISLINRKQVPLCKKCHTEAHGKPFFTIPDFRMPILLYDNRIIDSEANFN